jgi:cyclic beta-1,2-glucan synthetase
MYRAGVEGILGLRREGAFLVVDPCIPTAWAGFDATVKIESTRYDIRVEAPAAGARGVPQAVLDGVQIDCEEGRVRVALDGGAHRLSVVGSSRAGVAAGPAR